MNAPRTIRVTPVLVPVPKGDAGKGTPRKRYRWSAELIGTGLQTHGHAESLEAVGALIREAVQVYASHDEIIDFIAGLFGDIDHRNADHVLGRAVYYANKSAARKHPGFLLDLVVPAPRAQRGKKKAVSA